jgi:hypothetical protein
MDGNWVRIGLLVVGLTCPGLWPAAAAAQEVVNSFPALQGRVLIGETVTVTDQAGLKTKGKLKGLTDSTIALETEKGPQTLQGDALTKVEAVRSGPLWNGALIGALVPTVPFVIIAAKEGCSGCATGAMIMAAMGAGIGVGIDALVKGNVTVMDASRPDRKARLIIAPMIDKDRKGALCAIRF